MQVIRTYPNDYSIIRISKDDKIYVIGNIPGTAMCHRLIIATSAHSSGYMWNLFAQKNIIALVKGLNKPQGTVDEVAFIREDFGQKKDGLLQFVGHPKFSEKKLKTIVDILEKKSGFIWPTNTPDYYYSTIGGFSLGLYYKGQEKPIPVCKSGWSGFIISLSEYHNLLKLIQKDTTIK